MYYNVLQNNDFVYFSLLMSNISYDILCGREKYKIGTQEHNVYMVQPYDLRPWRKSLRATSLLYKSVTMNHNMDIYSRLNPRLIDF